MIEWEEDKAKLEFTVHGFGGDKVGMISNDSLRDLVSVSSLSYFLVLWL